MGKLKTNLRLADAGSPAAKNTPSIQQEPDYPTLDNKADKKLIATHNSF